MMPSKAGPPSALLCLAPELLSHIFICYKQLLDLSSNFSDGDHDLYAHTCNTIEPSNDNARGILLLGSISQYLRKVAWGTPQLWSHLVVCISDTPSRSSAQIAGLSSWLVRSADVPLSVRLQYSTTHRGGCDASLSLPQGPAVPLAAMQAIRAHSSHWEELCLALPSECYSSFFEHARTHKLPLLKRLTLLFHNAWPTSLLFTGRPLTTAPALSDISLINLPAYSSMLALPWDQITHFRGSLLYLADALDTLNEAPLESCTLTSSLGNPSTIDIPIHPPYLRDLILEGNTRALKYITVPALETLSIRTDGAFPTQQCVQFLRRSGCILQSLDIAVDFIAATDLVSCLACTPGLRELKIHNQNDRVHSLFGNFIMQRLTLGDHIILVPRLQRLDVLGCHCLFDTNVLASMLRSRWDVCGNGKAIAEKGRLDSFFLEASLTISKEIMHSPWIWRLVEEGMDIQVRALEVV